MTETGGDDQGGKVPLVDDGGYPGGTVDSVNDGEDGQQTDLQDKDGKEHEKSSPTHEQGGDAIESPEQTDPIIIPDPVDQSNLSPEEKACLNSVSEPQTGDTSFEVEVGARKVHRAKEVRDDPSTQNSNDKDIASHLDIDIMLSSKNDSAFEDGVYVWMYASL